MELVSLLGIALAVPVAPPEPPPRPKPYRTAGGWPTRTPEFIVFRRGDILAEIRTFDIAQAIAAEYRGAVIFRRVMLREGGDE
jgi:hypothetical protein